MKANSQWSVVSGQLADALAHSTCTGLHLPAETSLDQWAAMGRELYRRAQIGTWWLADWAAYGEKKYGRLKEFCDANGVNYGTVRNLAIVAAAVAVSRRRDNLSFSHHVEVAALSAREQDRWLAQAEKENWPVAELRRRIRSSAIEHPPEHTYGPSDEGVELQKLFLDAGAALERKEKFFKENPEEGWAYAEPFLRKAAKMFPGRVEVKS